MNGQLPAPAVRNPRHNTESKVIADLWEDLKRGLLDKPEDFDERIRRTLRIFHGIGYNSAMDTVRKRRRMGA